MASSYRNYHPIDEILTSLAQEAVQSDDAFIANRIFEEVQTPARSGTLLIEESRNYSGAGAGQSFERAPGADRIRLSGFDRSSTTFNAKTQSASDVISMQEIEDSQYPGSEEQRLVKKLGRAMMINREKLAANLLFDSSTFTTVTPSTKFDAAGGQPLDFLHSNPIETVIANAQGIQPDSMILGYDVFRALQRNPEIRGIAGGGQATGFTDGRLILTHEETLRVLRDKLSIPNIYIGQGRHDTAVKGATSSSSLIWNNESIWIGILKGSDAVTNRQGVKLMPTAALCFRWKALVSGQFDDLAMTRREVYADEDFEYKVIDSNYGVLVNNCLT